MILGIDEAGRGPWAGPLVVGAVVLGGVEIEGLTDSKKLTKKKREALYSEITARALTHVSGWVSASELDEVGMSAALRLATRRAVEQIKVPYSEIIIDGTVNFLADTGKGKYVKTMPKADLLIPSVSAASIIAKVERDRYMEMLDEQYPGYGFKGHAGYGVARHRVAIEQLGVTPEHRLSFAPLAKYRKDTSVRISPKKPRLRRIFSTSTSWSPVELSALKQSSDSQDVAAKNNGQPQNSSDDIQTSHATTRMIGNFAEDAAALYLQKSGHTILDRNWRTKFCEIDIVSSKGDTIYFTEVKYRKNDTAGDGLAMITPKKLRQMQFAARLYAHNLRANGVNLRLAAVSVTGTPPKITDYVEI